MFVRVAARSELAPGTLRAVEAEGRRLVLVNAAGSFYALDPVCPHASGPLEDGGLEGSVLSCSWHGWTFDVTSGASVSDPPSCVRVFPVRLEDDDVLVEVAEAQA